MIKPSFLRHSAWINDSVLKNTYLNIIGCGAVGSNAAMIAARMGWTRFRLWDDDTVADHNLPNQAFYPPHIGKLKVEALEEQLTAFNSDIRVEIYNKRFVAAEDSSRLSGVVLISTDSMASRSDIYNAIALNGNISQVIETRLDFDFAEVYTFDPMNYGQLSAWRDTLRSDDEIPDGPCNLRLCTTLVLTIASSAIHFACVPYAVWRSEGVKVPPFRTRYLLSDNLVVSSFTPKN